MTDTGFLPATPEELKERGIGQPDFVYVIGDAYVDHPSFGPAIIGRALDRVFYTVAILSQPDWKGSPEYPGLRGTAPGLSRLLREHGFHGEPLFCLEKAQEDGCLHAGGVMGKRPDRADMVYSSLIRSVYRHTPIILGGIEASLRRLAHYDYWSDSFKRSLLLDSGADLISYGMGERSIVEIADALASGIAIRDLTFVEGTVYKASRREDIYDAVFLPDYESMKADKRLYRGKFRHPAEKRGSHPGKEAGGGLFLHTFIVQNPPAKPLSQEEMDAVYALPFQRAVHPACLRAGGGSRVFRDQIQPHQLRGCLGPVLSVP